MKYLKHISLTLLLTAMLLPAMLCQAQSAGPDAVYYVCAEQGFKLTVTAGFDHYQWMADSVGMPGLDSNTTTVPAMGAAAVGNTYKKITYTVLAMNNASCWSDAKTYVVYILPKMELTVSGYTPPYCEHLSHDIPLTARVNGDTGSAALNLPPGVNVKYSWTIEPASTSNSLWNAEIIGSTDSYHAQVVTPQTTSVDNVYTVKAAYAYPATTNINTDVVGNCNAAYTQTVHADPAPPVPSINYQSI